MISTIRHAEIFNPAENNQRITIVGAGAVGSRIFATLVELGLTNITVYDFDVVESHNLANQIYSYADIGKNKVDALAEWAQRKLGSLPIDMTFIHQKVDKTVTLKGSVFLLVDSMDERRKLFHECIKGNTNIYRVIDCRMAASHGDVMVFDAFGQGAQWLNTLISDDEAETSGCGSPFSVSPTANIISNLAVWQFINAKTNPQALDHKTLIYTAPLMAVTSNWSNTHESAAA